MEKQIKQKSKFLALVLRHRPELIGIEPDAEGWVSVEDLLKQCKAHGRHLDLDLLEKVVNENDKQRFAFDESRQKIRASQGHSIKVALGYAPSVPPAQLYHGTATRFLKSIRQQGLQKRSRHHVHLSADRSTARNVGSRHGLPIILEIDAEAMQQAGFHFYLSENKVWLTDHVPV
ncbi:MAG: RNA 2'-phosphotransferase, partial [Bacteroidota bacterium]